MNFLLSSLTEGFFIINAGLLLLLLCRSLSMPSLMSYMSTYSSNFFISTLLDLLESNFSSPCLLLLPSLSLMSMISREECFLDKLADLSLFLMIISSICFSSSKMGSSVFWISKGFSS